MTGHFPNIFQPLDLRHKTLRNRIVFGAHTANMAEQGLPGERHLGYYRERALGGAAMIVVEPVPVHETAVLTRGNFRHSDDAVIPGFRAITDACHDAGAVMIHQLYHVGQHGDFDNSYQPGWSPSGLPSFHDSDGSHAMSETEIEVIIEAFAAAAERAQRSGFDGIELFAAYNALIDQFWSPWNNRRDDRWGGSFDNRMRFSTTVIDRIRDRVGDNFIIGMAISVDDRVDIALGTEALCEVIAYHDQRALIDYVTCGTGSYFDFTGIIPPFFFADKLSTPTTEALKGVVSHAKVQSESLVRTPENADYVIASGQADMVSIVRGQIADPFLARKAETGRVAEIRGCISCNQMCWGRRHRDYWISCLVNPSAGREFQWGGDRFEPAERPQIVLVVGAGPAGLECARVAAERGHRVTVVEATGDLGGQFRLAGMQPRRGQILDLLDWYRDELQRLQVRVDYNTYLEVDEVNTYGADTIVVATGSQPSENGFQRGLPDMDTLPGIDRPNVWSIEEVMRREARLGQRVLLVDDTGDWRGGGTAWHVAEQGHAVTIVTGWSMLGKWIERTAGDGLLRAKLKDLGATWLTESALTQWHGDGGTVRCLLSGIDQTIAADSLVLATTNRAETTLADALAGTGKPVHLVGDCVAPRLAAMAIYEGRKLGREI